MLCYVLVKGFRKSYFLFRNAILVIPPCYNSAVAVARSPAVASWCRRALCSFVVRRQLMDTRFKDRPLFAVVGSTGTGKTKLGVRLARELDGEVVSADSIQVYKGLDVATNKATEEETEGVPHHMMGTVDWDDECNVHDYRNEALKIIDDIYARGKVPVVVGGTSYYIESLIYNNLVRSSEDGGGVNDSLVVEEQDDDDDDDEDDDDDGAAIANRVSVDALREYALFRNGNDASAADTADGAGRMYADALVEAVRFVRTLPAVGLLSFKRYRNTFAPPADNDRSRWPPTVAECETAALYAHGVRVLDAAANADTGILYDVLAADVVTGRRERYAAADVRSRLDTLLTTARADDSAAAVREVLCRAYDELEKRVQRFALALLVDNEQAATSVLSPHALKAHAAYFDPAAASVLHPHNTRKVFRTIQIYLKQGKQKSKLFEAQRVRVNGSDVPVMALQFKEVHMMWLSCDVDVLNRRLENRTDEMAVRGLIDELCDFKNELAKKTGTNNFSLDFTKGVLQCIGVRQFQQYLELSDEDRRTEKGRKALEDALTAMKYVTKKYARRQTRWIKNRFLSSNDKQAVLVYQLDCTDLENWQQLSDEAVDLAQVVLGRKPRTERTLKPIDVSDKKKVVPVYGDYFCDDCSRLFCNDIQYNIHMASKKHVRVMRKRKRKLQDTTLCCDSDNENKIIFHKKS